jgi:hypothetical protein
MGFNLYFRREAASAFWTGGCVLIPLFYLFMVVVDRALPLSVDKSIFSL